MNVFDELLQNESFVDVTLACDGNSIKAHKMVLSACSPYFQSLFFDNPCQHPTIIMRDVKWPELKAAVEFMYKGEINVSQEQIEPLIRVAEMLRIRGLTDVNSADTDFVATAAAAKQAQPLRNYAVATASSFTSSNDLPEITALKKQRLSVRSDWDMLQQHPDLTAKLLSPSSRYHRKNRRSLGEKRKEASPMHHAAANDEELAATTSILSRSLATVRNSNRTPISTTPFAGMPPMDEPMPSFMKDYPQADEEEIKPGIVEMIREEEKVGSFKLSLISF